MSNIDNMDNIDNIDNIVNDLFDSVEPGELKYCVYNLREFLYDKLDVMGLDLTVVEKDKVVYKTYNMFKN